MVEKRPRASISDENDHPAKKQRQKSSLNPEASAWNRRSPLETIDVQQDSLKPHDTRATLQNLYHQISTSVETRDAHISALGGECIKLFEQINRLLSQSNIAKTKSVPKALRIPGPTVGESIRPLGPSASLGLPHSLPALPATRPGYLSDAPFVHSSARRSEDSAVAAASYDRLEFLGDAYLEVVASRIIYSRFPNYSPGKMAQLRESMVCNETLARFANHYGFGHRIISTVVPDEKALKKAREKGRSVHTKLLADVFEAYVAAIVLSWPEDGFVMIEDWLTQLWSWAGLLTQPAEETDITNAPKDELAKKLLLPGVVLEYEEERPPQPLGKGHGDMYFMAVYLTGWHWKKQYLGSGADTKKSRASWRAAKHALERSRDIIDQAVAKKQDYVEKKAIGSELSALL